MKEIIHIDPSRRGHLHCDACGHDLPDALPFSAALIGYPCPKCAANMLTREDYEASEKMFGAVKWINKWLGPIFGHENVADHPNAVSIGISHHAGKVVIEKRDHD